VCAVACDGGRENIVAWVGVCDAARIRGQITLGHAHAMDARSSFAAVWLSRQSFLLVVRLPCVVRLCAWMLQGCHGLGLGLADLAVTRARVMLALR
jgi:hypothetical protein